MLYKKKSEKNLNVKCQVVKKCSLSTGHYFKIRAIFVSTFIFSRAKLTYSDLNSYDGFESNMYIMRKNSIQFLYAFLNIILSYCVCANI